MIIGFGVAKGSNYKGRGERGKMEDILRYGPAVEEVCRQVRCLSTMTPTLIHSCPLLVCLFDILIRRFAWGTKRRDLTDVCR